jgi:hypothetical protein
LRTLARSPGGRRFVGLDFAFLVFTIFSGNDGVVTTSPRQCRFIAEALLRF